MKEELPKTIKKQSEESSLKQDFSNLIKKTGSNEQFLIFIIFSIIILGFLSYYNQESSDIFLWYVQEDRVFDPLCMIADYDEQSDPSQQSFCRVRGAGSSPMVGASYYFETEYNFNDLRFFALKIKIPELAKSNPFVITEMHSAKLQLHMRYDGIKDDPFLTEVFSIHHGLCDDILWSEQDIDPELTCLSEYKNVVSKIDTFYGTLDANFIQVIDLDIFPHIQYAQFFDIDEYTETVRFTPISLLKDRQVDSQVRECLNNIEHISERRACVEQYQIHIFTNDYPKRFDFHPKLFVEYTQTPTSLTNSLYIVSLILIPIFGTSMLYFRHKRFEQNSKMKNVCKSLKKEVDDTYNILKEYPTSGKLIDTFTVRYDESTSPLKITLTDKFNNELLLHDAYDGVKNSGLLHNFKQENLIYIITFYNQIKNYNENLKRLYQINLKAIFSITPKNVDELKWKYETEIKRIAEHVGKARNTIVGKIEDIENGILQILKEEEQHFS